MSRYGWFYVREVPDGREWDAPVNVYRLGSRGGVMGYEATFDRPSKMRTLLKNDEPDAEIVRIPRGYFKCGRWIKE